MRITGFEGTIICEDVEIPVDHWAFNFTTDLADEAIHPALEGFLSYAQPGNYDPAPYFYPEMDRRGGDMTIKEKAAAATIQDYTERLKHALNYGYAVDVEYQDGTGRESRGGLVSDVGEGVCQFRNGFTVELAAVTRCKPIYGYQYSPAESAEDERETVTLEQWEEVWGILTDMLTSDEDEIDVIQRTHDIIAAAGHDSPAGVPKAQALATDGTDAIIAENAELKRQAQQTTIDKLTAQNLELQQELAAEEERESDDAKTINGQSKRIRELCDQNADLECRNAELERSLGEPEQTVSGTDLIKKAIKRAGESGQEVIIQYTCSDGDRGLSGNITGIQDTLFYLAIGAGITYKEIPIAFEDVVAVIPVGKPDPPRDIASERWRVVCNADGVFALYADTEPVATITMEGMSKEQVYLMTEAPKLADKLRTHMNEVLNITNPYGVPDYIVEAIRLLRSLGIPNVAEWWQDDESSLSDINAKTMEM